MIPVLFYLQHLVLVHLEILDEDMPNPFERLLVVTGKKADGKYAKTWWDLAFIGYYVVVWSL